ncbi:MAG: flagellar biosynthetic protein FliR [Gammaproteobacteria bacterium]|nr:flagellar biosynthetic protein FliR [Gammaproteobacteria bacterium]
MTTPFLQLDATELNTLIGVYLWPFTRIVGMIMVAPVFSAGMVSPRMRVLVSVTLTLIIVPLVPPPPPVNPMSVTGALITVQQLVIGIGMGFALQMVFDALIIAGQASAMSMGLGFAIAVDPQRGVNVPVVSQYFMVLATLAFLAIDGHVMIIETLANSFAVLPVSETGLQSRGIEQLVYWGTHMFAGAVKIALPAMTALLIVNLAFGVISRAAPTLNLFAVGFPITMILGFVILMVSVPNIVDVFLGLLESAFSNSTGILLP